MRRLALAVLVLLSPAACGKEGGDPAKAPLEAGKRGLPEPPGAPPPGLDPEILKDPGAWSWGHTRVGDWATWEIRVTGKPEVTRLTWKATKVEGTRVTYSVSSKTTAADGTEVASQEATAVHEPEPPAPEDVRWDMSERAEPVGDGSVRTVVRSTGVADKAATAAIAWDVPFGGIVNLVAVPILQRLVAFGRGAAAGK